MFQLFDYSDASVMSSNRATTTVAPQALFMLNAELVLTAADALATRLADDLPDGVHAVRARDRIIHGYRLTLGRRPTPAEVDRDLEYLKRFQERLREQPSTPAANQVQAWSWLCQSWLAANEFIYVRESLPTSPFWTRRRLLQFTAIGFGHLASSALLCESSQAALPQSASPLAPKPTHFPPRARRVIFLFMKGGPSHLDTFDYKPPLQRDDGKELPFAKPRVQFAPTGKLLRSPWKFQPAGQCGMLISELFPHLARRADDICFLHSLHGTNAAHGGASLKLHTGSDRFVRPSMGAWVSYGLGTENENLPGFLTICPTLAHGGVKNWSSAFLPAYYQGTPLGVASRPATEARLNHAANPTASADVQRIQLDLLHQLNRDHEQLNRSESGSRSADTLL